MVDAFSCVETSKMLLDLNLKVRRRIAKHLKEMENLLKKEALKERKKFEYHAFVY